MKAFSPTRTRRVAAAVRTTLAHAPNGPSNPPVRRVVEHSGAYRYDGVSFTNYYANQGLTSHALHFVYQDRAGRIWSGGWLGAFRLDGERFVNVTRNGPW